MIWVRRILGIIILLATTVVIIALFAAAYYLGPALDRISDGVDSAMALTVDTLNTVSATLVQTQSTLGAISSSLDTAAQTTTNLSTTVVDTIPLIDQISVVISDQLPENIEAMQAAIPNIATVAGVVDDALTTLSNFGVQQTIPIPFNPITIDFDLGIDYAPTEPFDQSIARLGDSLEGLPDELRALQSEMEVAAANMETLSSDLLLASGDLTTLSVELAKFVPLLDQYLVLLDQAIDAVGQMQAQFVDSLETIRQVGTILTIALMLTQLAPLVVGWQLLTSKEEEQQVIVKEVAVITDPEEIKAREEVQPELDPGDTILVASHVDDDSGDTIIVTSQSDEPEKEEEED